MALVGARPSADRGGAGGPPSTQAASAPRWIAKTVTDLAAFFAAATGLDRPSGFQTTAWQRALIDTLSGPERAEPRLLRLDPPCGGAPLLLPLVVTVERGARVGRFASFGVTDYNAPIGATLCGSDKVATAHAVVAAIRAASAGIDVLRLDNMLPSAGNPLLAHPLARAARHQGNSLTLTGSVEDLLKSRGKKYRKEVERCYRLLDGEGPWRFALANTPADIDAAYAALEAQQAERHAGGETGYALDTPHVSTFYRTVLANSAQDSAGFGRIYTLTVNDKIIAVLLGIVHGQTFILLRIANGGPSWRHLSPGRLVVVEAMRHGLTEGITTYDMGIGDYAFKRGFGCEKIALTDLTVALTIRGQPYVQALAAKARLRDSEVISAAVNRVKAALRASRHRQTAPQRSPPD
ncbi:MAG: GNAT family N-acetyltransferase [Hyphomicrobiaceae bacterium]|nr:GNAT family N-acetyltransferase [Hyphomicrobiaceae bacterium]